MKKIPLLCIMIFGLLMTACGGVKNATSIVETGTSTYQSFDDVYEIIEDNISAFSPRDVARLKVAGEIITSIKVEIYAQVIKRGSLLKMVADLPDLIPLYERARAAYLMASNIVMDEIDEFDRVDQITLYAFQDTCARLDATITNAINSAAEENARNAQLVRDIISFVVLVGKIAVPLIII